ncbi:hypothetical protein [Ruminococcus albus]|uniref:hypothetical protein n=1 Tax=Ruminococcus albus TaxID=1264 RepID=UPI000462FA82|nr:hypothetical protein [Ruminococcus albus]
MDKTTSITTIKKEMQLQEWSAQIKSTAGKRSDDPGMVQRKMGSSQTRITNRLRKVREKYIENFPTIVPVSVPCSNENIHIEKNGLQISLPADISAGHSDRFGA